MYPSPASTINVIVRTDPAPWWQILAAVGPYIIILLAEIVWIVLSARANRRGKTAMPLNWEQMCWALDASLSENAQKVKMGHQVLDALSRLPLSKNDRELLRVASQRVSGPGETEQRELEDK